MIGLISKDILELENKSWNLDMISIDENLVKPISRSHNFNHFQAWGGPNGKKQNIENFYINAGQCWRQTGKDTDPTSFILCYVLWKGKLPTPKILPFIKRE